MNWICSRLVIDSFGFSNALFLDMLARFSSRLAMLLLGLSDALLHLIAILLLFVVALMETVLQYVPNYCNPHKYYLYQCGTPPSVLHHGATFTTVAIT